MPKSKRKHIKYVPQSSNPSPNSEEESPEQKRRFLVKQHSSDSLVSAMPPKTDLSEKIDRLLDKLDGHTDKIDALLQSLNQVLEENKLLRQENKQLTQENSDLRVRVASLESKGAAGVSTQDNFASLLKCHRELAEQQEKKPNFVVYGLKELADQRSDEEIVRDIFEKSKADPSVIQRVFRMGKMGNKFPRLLKVQTSSVSEKLKVMTQQREVLPNIPEFDFGTVSGYSKYFRDDLTAYQRTTYFELKVERDKRNQSIEDGYIWRILDGALVKKRKYDRDQGL